ncbi:hypothetical protein J2782_000979 [Brucella pseudogrignonensis]|uniref:Uncharacterized protein n=1 Tax=Brucella pseudogrignonensis TaxID=419475 RepID=A0ABU1M5G7_9HYPH|nr:hypothetical protein [Brucella pseudogrignonensis]
MKIELKDKQTSNAGLALAKLSKAGWTAEEFLQANKKAAKAYGFRLPWIKRDH